MPPAAVGLAACYPLRAEHCPAGATVAKFSGWLKFAGYAVDT